MRRTIITICFSLSGLIILDSLDIGHALMMFLLAGVIPGTNIALSASITLEIFALLTGFVLARLARTLIFTRFTRQSAS